MDEYPRQGDVEPEINLAAPKPRENIQMSEGEVLGEEIKRRIRKGREEGVTFDPSRSDE